MAKIVGLGHASFTVLDLDRTINFSQDSTLKVVLSLNPLITWMYPVSA
jgi:hypothetical protein